MSAMLRPYDIISAYYYGRGRPREGDIFLQIRRAKLAYKQAIRMHNR